MKKSENVFLECAFPSPKQESSVSGPRDVGKENTRKVGHDFCAFAFIQKSDFHFELDGFKPNS